MDLMDNPRSVPADDPPPLPTQGGCAGGEHVPAEHAPGEHSVRRGVRGLLSEATYLLVDFPLVVMAFVVAVVGSPVRPR